jgi:hypothetical protein
MPFRDSGAYLHGEAGAPGRGADPTEAFAGGPPGHLTFVEVERRVARGSRMRVERLPVDA